MFSLLAPGPSLRATAGVQDTQAFNRLLEGAGPGEEEGDDTSAELLRLPSDRRVPDGMMMTE
jgi:hypothetical protein